LRRGLGGACAALLAAACFTAATGAAAAPSTEGQAARVEARSAIFLAVGVVHDDRMSIHLSRVLDNTPVRDATLTVAMRGQSHPATAETDGSYSFESKDLTLPGAAAVVFQVTEGGLHERLDGSLQTAGAADKPEDRNNARQLWWWVLNFAVCIGILVLYSRRRKAAED
jgi:hypothetical protein